MSAHALLLAAALVGTPEAPPAKAGKPTADARTAVAAEPAAPDAQAGVASDPERILVTDADEGRDVASLPPRMGQDLLSARVPAYPGVGIVRVGESLTAHGMPMNVQTFETPDTPAKVLGFYEDAFTKEKLPMMGNGELIVRMPYPSVTAFDDQNGVDISVVAMRDVKDAVTTVLVSQADVRTFFAHAHEDEQPFGRLPPYPGAQGAGGLEANDGDARQAMVSFATADAPEQVAAFYARELGKQGFVAQVGASPEELHLVGKDATWRLQWTRSGEPELTHVMATWIDRAQQPEVAP